MLIKATNNQYLSLGVVQGSKNCNGILLIVVTYCTISLQSNNLLTVQLAEKHQLRKNVRNFVLKLRYVLSYSLQKLSKTFRFHEMKVIIYLFINFLKMKYRIRAVRSPGFYFPSRVFGWASNQIYHTWASNQASRYCKMFFQILYKIYVIWHTYATY